MSGQAGVPRARYFSKEPKESFRDFLMGEVRYAQLTTAFPDIAEELFDMAEQNAKDRYETYKNLAESENFCRAGGLRSGKAGKLHLSSEGNRAAFSVPELYHDEIRLYRKADGNSWLAAGVKPDGTAVLSGRMTF